VDGGLAVAGAERVATTRHKAISFDASIHSKNVASDECRENSA